MLNISGELLNILDADEYYLFSILLNYGTKSRPDNKVLLYKTGWGLQKLQKVKKSLSSKGLLTVNARFDRKDNKRGRASNEYKIKTKLASKYNGVQLNDFNVIEIQLDENHVTEIQLDDFKLDENQVENKVLKYSIIEIIKLLKEESVKELTQERAVLGILVEQLRAENERLIKNQKDEKEKEKSSAKKEKAFVPVHQNQLFQKPYEMELVKFNYPENWNESLIDKFREWCESQHEKCKGRFGNTNVKAIIRQINQFLNKYSPDLVADSIEYSLQNPKYNKFDPQWVIDQQQKKKKDEQKRQEQQSSGGGLYDNWAQIVNNGINQHTDESGNGTIDTSWADAQH